MFLNYLSQLHTYNSPIFHFATHTELCQHISKGDNPFFLQNCNPFILLNLITDSDREMMTVKDIIVEIPEIN